MTRTLLLLAIALACGADDGTAETRSLSLREAIALAIAQNPDAQLARLEVQRAATDLALVRAERSASLQAGSGLGATAGIPQSIQGAAPSVVQITMRQPLINFGRGRRASAARESVASESRSAEAVTEDFAYRAGLLYLDFEFATGEVERLREQLESYERIEEMAALRVESGTDIPLALSRARLDTARAAERHSAATARLDLLEADLRRTLGLPRSVRLSPVPSDKYLSASLDGADLGATPRSHDRHPEMEALAAGIRAARQSAKEARADRLPRLDIVGQYSLLARFNNYEDYFRQFQRHNWQGGVALAVPLFTGRGVAERVARARLDERELELRRTAKREDLELRALRADASLQEAGRVATLARQELDFARESAEVLLARFEEGQVSLDELEQARVVESAAWSGMIEARYALAKARLGVIHSAGGIRDAFGD